jgi:excisionase family DNA binding protein
MDGTARLLKVGQAAQYLGVSTASLRMWSNRGLVPAYRTPGGQRRYDRADLDAFMLSMREADRGGQQAASPPRPRRASNRAAR